MCHLLEGGPQLVVLAYAFVYVSSASIKVNIQHSFLFLFSVFVLFPFCHFFVVFMLSLNLCRRSHVRLLPSRSRKYRTGTLVFYWVYSSKARTVDVRNTHTHIPIKGQHRTYVHLSFLFCFCFVFMLSLELCKCASDIFLSSRQRTGLATTYITGYG